MRLLAVLGLLVGLLALAAPAPASAAAKLTLTAKNANGQTSAPRTVKLKIKR